MQKPDFDVAIVGLGPVGGLGALLLAHAGLKVVVAERETVVVDLPRAVNIDGEIVRAFQRLGYGEEIAATTQPPRDPDEVAFTNSKREILFGTTLPRFGHNGFRDVAFFDQPELEAKIRELLDRRGGIDLRLGHEVIAVENQVDCATLRTKELATGAEETLSAAFVIGCDGASSFVRQALNIEWQSLGYDQDWLVVDIVLEPEADLPILTMQVCDPARLTTYVCVKDPNRRWEFQLLPGETRAEMLRPERIRELLDDWLPPEHYSVRRAAVYQFHAATAQRWREGRVFLAGDAAHQTPPFLGQGLNTGCRDVVNLAWKLCLVLDRSCGDELLDTYAAERDAHARDLVEWAVAIGKLMEAMAAIEAGKPPADPAAADQSSGYGQGRTAPPLQGGVIMVEQQSEDSSTGHVLRQPTVRTPDGQECRLDELLGAGFAVVARDPEALVLSAASRAFLDRLGARMVSLQGIELVEGDLDRLFVDHDVAIVRPDRYVFGTTDENWSLDALVAALERKLAVRASGGSRS